MPEGPEIWRTSDKINNAIAGKEVEGINFAFEELKKYESLIEGSKVETVSPRGKAIVTAFDNGLNIYSHNQLYGKWMISERGAVPETNRSLRLEIHTYDKSAFLFSASEIEVLKNEEVEEHSYVKKLGPDVVNPQTDFEQVLKRYNNEKYRNRKVATLLLDPGFLSGIGNYLRSEIMFCSKVNPSLKLRECSEEQTEHLARYSLELPRRSYETGGLTTPDNLVRALKEEGATKKQYRHFVYGREGKRCYKCGSVIRVDKTGGRKVYYCPEEQKNS